MLNGLAPVWRPDARVLVLGSFPGVASLGAQQYYAHPRNAFWPLMSALLGQAELPQLPYEQRLQRLIEAGIALWDAVATCQREGSLDSAIRGAQPSDLPTLVSRLPQLRLIACNGATAFQQTERLLPGAPWPLLKLPSTSPAHAGLGLDAKVTAWRSALGPTLSHFPH
jgi:hypoxanthine-DNA glycosylase